MTVFFILVSQKFLCSHAIFEDKFFLYKYGEQIKGILKMTCGTISGGPINFFTWNSLYPYNYSSNFGGQYQFNVMPSFITPAQAFGIQNVFNPFYHLTQIMGRVSSMFNPYQNISQMMMGQAAYTSGFAIGDSIGTGVIAQGLADNITSLKTKLEQALTSKQLTNEQKDELRALKREVEALEDKMNNIKELQRYGATSAQVKAGISQLNGEYRELRDKIQSAAERITADIETVQAESTEVIQDKDETESSALSEAIESDITLEQEVRLISDAFADSIDGWGTRDKDFEEVLTYINSANIIEVMQHWDRTYKNQYDKTFIEAFLSDASPKQKRDYGKYLLEQLQMRADFNGVNIDTEAATIRSELNDTFKNKKKIKENFNMIYEKIVAAEQTV